MPVRLCATLCVCLAAPLTSADVITLGAGRDNTLYEDPNGTLSNGAGQHFFAGRTLDGELRRGLLYFDVAGALPAGAQITGASLTLYMSKTVSGAQTVALHRLAASWGEAGSVAPGEEGSGGEAQPGDATWLQRFYASQHNWTTPGGDFAQSPSATASVAGIGYYTWTGAGLLADVQSWLATPAGNFGWAVRGNETAIRSTKRFGTRENTEPLYRPALRIEYIPEPATALLLPLGALLSRVSRRGRAG
ncbi:MAG: DNRLRE domain-containing protein [Planctomycetota bacterium]